MHRLNKIHLVRCCMSAESERVLHFTHVRLQQRTTDIMHQHLPNSWITTFSNKAENPTKAFRVPPLLLLLLLLLHHLLLHLPGWLCLDFAPTLFLFLFVFHVHSLNAVRLFNNIRVSRVCNKDGRGLQTMGASRSKKDTTNQPTNHTPRRRKKKNYFSHKR